MMRQNILHVSHSIVMLRQLPLFLKSPFNFNSLQLHIWYCFPSICRVFCIPTFLKKYCRRGFGAYLVRLPSASELRTQNNLFRSVRPGDSTLRLVRVAIMRVTLCIHTVYLRNTRGGRHSSIHSNIHCLGSLRIIVIIVHYKLI